MAFIKTTYIVFIVASLCYAQQDTIQLRFEDYAVKNIFNGKPHKVDLTSDPDAKMYRTSLREQTKKGVNFAGHYTVVIWGCGTSTQAFAIVDVLTGKVYFSSELPFVSWAGWWEEEYGLKFRKDSNLLIAYGHRMEEEEKGIYFYLWDGSKLKLIKSIIKN